MALSAEERRQWNELVLQLAAEDPELSRPMTDGGSTRRAARTAKSALGLVLIAFVIVLLAVIVKIPLIGVLGFALMIMGGTRFLRSKHMDQPAVLPGKTSRDAS